MSDGDYSEKEKTDPYFIAKEFSYIHFLKPLSDCRRLIKIAKCGYDDISEFFVFSEEQKTTNKIEAMFNLTDELELLCRDCEFKMTKENWKIVNLLLNRVEEIKEVIDGISHLTKDHRTGENRTELNFKHFLLCLNELIDINAKIKIPLNNEYIIYPKGDAFDLGEWENDFVQGGG